MKYILIGAVVAIGGGVFVANYMIAEEIRSDLDQASAAMAMFGNLTYGDVSVTPFGDARVDQVRFEPHESDENYRVDRIAVKTSNLWTLYAMTHDMQQGEPPDHLQVAFEGIHLDLGGELMQAIARDMEASGSRVPAFDAAGCGDRTRFTFADMSAMGYGTTVSDLLFEYRIKRGGERFEFSGTVSTEEMHSIGFSAELGIDREAANAMAEQGAGASMNPQMAAAMGLAAVNLRSARVDVEDWGYASRFMDYCAQEAGMDAEAFRSHHLDAWQANWKKLHLEPGENVLAAYETYLDDPQTLSVVLDPRPPLELARFMGQPDGGEIHDRLDPRIVANGGESRPLDFALTGGMDLAQLQKKLEAERGGSAFGNIEEQESLARENADSTEAETPSATPEPEESKPETPSVISIKELPKHMGRRVVVELNDGSTVVGRVEALEDQRLKLRRELHGGEMVQPIYFRRIDGIELL
ncbi:hypothetical protein DES49_1319 [Halospina denitrificans]|uniref:Uncharacterized protein n=1 Tax=Halospina denitrificans TaxID=332522 RepID=A0A4R7JYB0_9GAMM|nr:hypothetical protein [Halospina denitrificans]TDT43501.1 hypothetical protein DES49_1319 [Halospina denitrificans]